MEKIIKRGDIYYANLNPVIGSEQGGIRPVLIISNDIGNKHSPTVIVAAITSRVQTKAKLPTHTIVNDFAGLDKDSVILLEQIRTIDKQRLQEYLGTLDRRFLLAVDKALAISVALERGGKVLDVKVDEYEAALKLIEILLEKGKINQATYTNIMKHRNSHISQAA